ncbi:Cdc25 phosphatase Ibp1 [Entomophthora muscae]|uniref:Cdc25 phosphatase Ibp1 n=1 Tax=Entomophthora muscae TaxID=34485 RepID=A0ACC2RKU6_9FUNG|nr:Cdc25 phosphatase Ibp1 [Entomophthora muscae]
MGAPAKPMANVRYIEPIELSSMMNYLKLNKDYSIIDVRDADFIGGNIVGAINVPSQYFHNHKAGLAEKLSSVPKIIFHCALSQERGPKCARIYHSYLTEVAQGKELSDDFTQEVMILRGGFTAWQTLFSKDSALTEKNMMRNYGV